MVYLTLNNNFDPLGSEANVQTGRTALSTADPLNTFFAQIERRAFKMAQIAVGNTEDALDLVQDAMLKLTQKYSHKPETEWGPLFYRILQSQIRDWYRRSKVRNRFRVWLFQNEELDSDPLQSVADPQNIDPQRQLASDGVGESIAQALQELPLRQQQVFLLRAWEGFDINQTAKIMGCSEGSVKTHYFRAQQHLRKLLGEHR